MQQLLHGIGSGNGSTGVPSVVGGCAKRKNNEDDSLSSSSKKKRGDKDDAAAFTELSTSIQHHSQSLVTAAQISAREQEKNRTASAREQEKNRTASRVSMISARIDALRDSQRDMVIRMTEPHVLDNQRAIDALEHALKGIDDEIASKTEELNGMLATPTRSNRSPDI
jgi:hypothetical protein